MTRVSFLLCLIVALLVAGCAGNKPSSISLPEFVGRISGKRTPEKYQATEENIAREFGAEYVKSYEGAEAFFLFRMTASQAAGVQADSRVQGVAPIDELQSFPARLEGGKDLSDEQTHLLAAEVCADYGLDLDVAFLLGFFYVWATPEQAAMLEADSRVEEVGFDGESIPE